MIARGLCCFRDILTRCLLQLREKLIRKLMKNGSLRAQNGLQFQKKKFPCRGKNANHLLYVNSIPELVPAKISDIKVIEKSML